MSMENLLQIFSTMLFFGLLGMLCVVGTLLSIFAISGTWLVVTATALAVIFRDAAFPNWPTVVAFASFCLMIEVFEFFAGAWGVRRRGGSRLAGVGAVVGGIFGMLLGTLIPVPVLAPLLLMFTCSFAFAYLIEYQLIKKREQAASVAAGAVIARILVIILKVSACLGMSMALLIGLLFGG